MAAMIAIASCSTPRHESKDAQCIDTIWVWGTYMLLHFVASRHNGGNAQIWCEYKKWYLMQIQKNIKLYRIWYMGLITILWKCQWIFHRHPIKFHHFATS